MIEFKNHLQILIPIQQFRRVHQRLSMIRNNKQLYRQNAHFTLPLLQRIPYEPFSEVSNKEGDKREQEKQNTVRRLSGNSEQITQIKPTFIQAYNTEIEIIIGQQNLYPLFCDISEQFLIVCSKDCFLVIKIEILKDQPFSQITDEDNPDNKKQQTFLKSNIKLGTYHKTALNEIPTCMAVSSYDKQDKHVYFGFDSGKILCYDIVRKSFEGSCDELNLPIMQIQALRKDEIIVVDSAGNVLHVMFSHKTFMDKIIKTLTKETYMSIAYKVSKKERLKKVFGKISEAMNANDNKENGVGVDTQVNSLEAQKRAHSENSTTLGLPYSYTKFSIPKNQRLKEKILPNTQIIALYRNNKLLVQSFRQDKKGQCISQTCLMGDIEEVGMIDFGIGGFQHSNNTHLLIVFSIKNQLHYFKGIEVEENYEWLHVNSTKFEDYILDGKFISNNLMLLLTEKNICLCNVTEEPDFLSEFNVKKFEYIDFFNGEEGLKFDKSLIYRNILQTLDGKNEFICLQGKRMITGRIDTWKAYLQRYVDEEKFNEAMIVALKIYNRHMKNLCGIHERQEIRNAEMKQFFEKITLTYMSYEIKKQGVNLENLMNLCLYFLVKTESCQYLFTTIFLAFKAYGLVQIMLKSIDQSSYIEDGELNVMSEQVLELLLKYFKQKGTVHRSEKLIMGFDLSLMEKSFLLTICMRESLYQGMIHICNQHGDFISPLLKLCGIYFVNVQSQSLKQKLIKQEVDKQTNIPPQNKIDTKDQQNQQKYLKEVIFYYLRQCLDGRNTEYGNQAAYIEMLTQLINFVFIPNTLDMLMKISPHDTILAVNAFFETKILQYILENEGKFFIKKNEYVDLKIFEENCISEFKVYQKMLATLVHLISEQKLANDKELLNQPHLKREIVFEIKKFLNYLVLKNQFPFISPYKKDCVIFFVENYDRIVHQKVLSELGDEQKPQRYFIQHPSTPNAYLMRLLDSWIRSMEIEISSKQDPDYSKMSQHLDDVLISINRNGSGQVFEEVKCYIYHEQQNFEKVMTTFLKMSHIKTTQSKIFLYLRTNVNKYPELLEQFIKNLSLLINLDKKETEQLLDRLQISKSSETESNLYEQIISNLYDHPEVQLKFIQRLLRPESNYNKRLSSTRKNKLALLHLQIVVKSPEHVDRLQEYIKRVDYPLEEAYAMCEEKQNKTGKAYLLIKNGRNLEGVVMLCEIFLKTCDEVFGTLAKKKPLESARKQMLDRQLEKVISNCQKEYRVDIQRGEQIWQKVIEVVFKHLRIVQNMKNTAIPEPIKEILKQIVQTMLEKAFSQVREDFFINKFCKQFPKLPFNVFMIAFSRLYDRMQFTNRLQFLESQLLHNDEAKLFRRILSFSYRGHGVILRCCECRMEIDLQKAIVTKEKICSYSCGHIYHKECMINQGAFVMGDVGAQEEEMRSQAADEVQEGGRIGKKLSRNGTCYRCLNETESFIECGSQRVEFYCLDINEKQEIKRKINKMAEYDLISRYEFEDRHYEWIQFKQQK